MSHVCRLIALGLIASTGLFGCRRAASHRQAVEVADATRPPPPPVGGTLSIFCDGEPPHLLYDLEPNVWIARISRDTIFETLIRYDPSMEAAEPELAASWQRSADGLTYDFQLRPGI